MAERIAFVDEVASSGAVGKAVLQDVLQASHMLGSISSIALASKLKRKQVRTVHKASALVWIERQEQVLRGIQHEFESTDLGCKSFIDRMESDGSKHPLKFAAHPMLSATQQRSSWELIVTLWECQWVDTENAFHVLDLILVPSVAVGTHNAGCVYDAIFCQKINRPAYEFVSFMREISIKKGSVREPDSASVMFRTFTFEMQQQGWTTNTHTHTAC